MENIRAFMLVRSITGLCTLVETYPENLEKQGESAQYIEAMVCSSVLRAAIRRRCWRP